jgi:hypothetical protein
MLIPIPNVIKKFSESVPFDEGADRIRAFGHGDLLKGMKMMRAIYEGSEINDEFWTEYLDVCLAYNAAHDGFAKLFNIEDE